MKIYFNHPTDPNIAIACDVGGVTEMIFGIEEMGDTEQSELPYQASLWYRSPTDYYFCLSCKVIGPKGEFDRKKLDSSGYTYCLPIADQSDGELYDEIIQVRLP